MVPEQIFFDTNVLFYALDRSAGAKHDLAKAWVGRAWQVVENTPGLIVEAIEAMERHQVSFWDASIVAAAPCLLTEN